MGIWRISKVCRKTVFNILALFISPNWEKTERAEMKLTCRQTTTAKAKPEVNKRIKILFYLISKLIIDENGLM